MSAEELRQRALDYHEHPKPGKIGVVATKSVDQPDDLTLAYSPGVAVPCLEIHRDPSTAYRYTAKGNLVGIISNGSAVLGLGDIGPLASKPVMEGKAMLFKKFADIDVFDIEMAAHSPERFVEAVLAIADTFGAINLEDIAAPDCFLIEERLSEQLSIPVMHDDQTGTAVVVCAALVNAIEIQRKQPTSVRIVCIGAGAAGIGVLRIASRFFGLASEQIALIDSRGLVTPDRPGLSSYKMPYARQPINGSTDLAEAMRGADIVIGVSGPGTITPDMVRTMAPRPVIMALANPNPEITPEQVSQVRDDAIVGTGRSDYPNQVNNSVCYPYLFRGALDAAAKKFTHQMFAAAIRGLASIAREPVPPEVRKLYPAEDMAYGPHYILPKQNDARLLETIAPAVRNACSGALAE